MVYYLGPGVHRSETILTSVSQYLSDVEVTFYSTEMNFVVKDVDFCYQICFDGILL